MLEDLPGTGLSRAAEVKLLPPNAYCLLHQVTKGADVKREVPAQDPKGTAIKISVKPRQPDWNLQISERSRMCFIFISLIFIPITTGF